MRSLKITFALITTSFLLFGCQQQVKDPQPGDTALGKHNDGTWTDGEYSGQTRDGDNIYPVSGTGYGDDVIIPVQEDGSGFGSDVLTPRDGSLSSAGSGTAFKSIYFGFDEYSVSESERGKLIETFQMLQNTPGAKLIAEGHTDWRGTNEYNLGLGDRRANSVKSFLLNLGIPSSTVNVLSKGELEATEGVEKSDPRAKEDRRVDLFIVN